MKIVNFFKKHSRYRKLLEDYNELLSRHIELEKDYEDAKNTVKTMQLIQEQNPKLSKCISDACKECKYCVQQWTPWNGHVIVGCNKNIVCECFDNGGKHRCVF